jgi:voltage-gated sodium channel
MTDQTRAEPAWQRSARRLVTSDAFQNTIVGVIILNAITIGVQTYPIPGWLHILIEWADRVFLGVFVVELVLRFAADGFRPTRFFRSGWNIFDFLVVAAAFIPGVSRNSTVLRLIRLLRVTRLIKMMPDISVLFDGMRRAAGPAFSLVALTVLLCCCATSTPSSVWCSSASARPSTSATSERGC